MTTGGWIDLGTVLGEPLKAVRIRPGTRVLVATSAPVDHEQATDIKCRLETRFPGVDFTLLTGTSSVAVMEPETTLEEAENAHHGMISQPDARRYLDERDDARMQVHSLEQQLGLQGAHFDTTVQEMRREINTLQEALDAAREDAKTYSASYDEIKQLYMESDTENTHLRSRVTLAENARDLAHTALAKANARHASLVAAAEGVLSWGGPRAKRLLRNAVNAVRGAQDTESRS